MANADTNRFMDQVRIRLPGAIDTVIALEFFSVMKEFLGETNMWQESVPFSAQSSNVDPTADPDVPTYQIVPNIGFPNLLMNVTDDQGLPVPADMPKPGYIRLHRTPDASATYKALVALTVRDPVTRDDLPQFPDWIMTQYPNELMDGLLARMMSQIAKPYSNPGMAASHMRRFNSAKASARIKYRHGNLYSAQRWAFPRGTR